MATLDSTPSASQRTERRTSFSQSCSVVGVGEYSQSARCVPRPRRRAARRRSGPDRRSSRRRRSRLPRSRSPNSGVWPVARRRAKTATPRTARRAATARHTPGADSRGNKPKPPARDPQNCPHGVPATGQPKLLADVFVALAQQTDEQGELHAADKGCGQDDDRRDHGPARDFAQETAPRRPREAWRPESPGDRPGPTGIAMQQASRTQVRARAWSETLRRRKNTA